MKRRQGNHCCRKGNNGIFSSLFGSKVTYRPGATKSALVAAYSAGKRFGDTGEFSSWWNKYGNKQGVSKKKAEEEFRRGVEGEPTAKAESRAQKHPLGIRGKYRGCNIYFDKEANEFFSACDRDSKFDTYSEAKKHVDYVKDQLRKNPSGSKAYKAGYKYYLSKRGKSMSADKNEKAMLAFLNKEGGYISYYNQSGVYSGSDSARERGLKAKELEDDWWEGFKQAEDDVISGRLENPGRSPLEITEGFHGRESEDETEILEEEIYSEELAGLGLLVELEIFVDDKHVVPIKFNYSKPDDTVLLVCDKEGNIEFVGGDQDLGTAEQLAEKFDLKEEDARKNKIPLGQVDTISYFADKHHLEGPKSQAKGTEYIHEFGEEDGDMPLLVYDCRNKKMELVGGSYTITDEGIRN